MPSPVPFRKVHKLLTDAGWTLTRVNGSHHIFTRTGHPMISIPVHQNQVKARYVKDIKKVIAETNRKENDA